jgi:geranylgeranyl pyrophosphate synthase
MSQILTKLSNINRETLEPNYYKTSDKLSSLLDETDKFIQNSFKDFIQKNTSPNLQEALFKSMNNKAHFERSLFVRIGYELFNNNWQSIKGYLLSTEFKYASLVVTDDIFDDNDIRMSNKSICKEYGDNIAISLAAILKSLSSLSLLGLKRETINSIAILDEKAHIQTYEGQILDIESEKKSIVALDESFYLDLIRKTTAEDIGFCFEAGGRLANCSEEDAIALRNAGVSLGIAMQLRDDLLDYIVDEDLINKEPFRDFNGKHLRLPIFLAYKFANHSEKQKILELYKSGANTTEDKNIIANLVMQEEVLIYIENLLDKLKQNSVSNINKIATNNQNILNCFNELINNVIRV